MDAIHSLTNTDTLGQFSQSDFVEEHGCSAGLADFA